MACSLTTTALAQDADAPAPVRVSVLAAEFAADAAAASAKYQQQLLTVEGPVAELAIPDDPGDGEALWVTLREQGASGPDVRAVFRTADLPENAEIYLSDDDSTQALLRRRDAEGNLVQQVPFVQVGQRLTVRGLFKDFNVGDIVLDNARKVPAPEPSADAASQR